MRRSTSRRTRDEKVRPGLALLKELGVNIEERSAGGPTPLAEAIYEGTAAQVRVLCELGADVHAVAPLRVCGGAGARGRKCLLIIHAAYWNDCDAKVHALLQHGADPRVVDQDGILRIASLGSATLCDDGEDAESAWNRFLGGLPASRFRRTQRAMSSLSRRLGRGRGVCAGFAAAIR
jgi:hypothetical protein